MNAADHKESVLGEQYDSATHLPKAVSESQFPLEFIRNAATGTLSG